MSQNESVVGRHEAVFSIFMAAVAFLWQKSGGLADPGLLALFAALMGVNLAASLALRRWPQRRWLAAAISLSNCGVVAAIVERSEGAQSVFWVLYLLPIYSSCVLLGGREMLLIAAGALAFNAAGAIGEAQTVRLDTVLALAVKTAVLSLAAAVTYRLAERERAAHARLARQRAQTEELEALTRAQRVRLEETSALADAGLMSAGLAHDLNNALTVVLGFVEVALASSGAAGQLRDDLGRIRNSAGLAKRLASSLLGVTRRTTVAPERLDVNETLRDVLDIARGALIRAGVELRLELGEPLPPVLAVRTQLQRLFLNLVTNAARALSERKGTLTVAARQEQTNGGRQVVITVEDDGPGLPPAVLASLFQPFAKGGAAEGHGLGLYICWEIARDNGGRLHGENRPEGGARFTLFLPDAAESSAAAEPRRVSYS